MKNWQRQPLAQLATCLDSQRIPINEEDRQLRIGSVPYYGANGQVGWIDKALFDEPLLLVAEDGGHFDAPQRGVAYAIRGPAWVNNHAHILRADKNIVLLEFLHYYLRHFDFRPYITGTTRGKLTQRDLMRVEAPVPSLPEQNRIVNLLSEADELRRLRSEADRRATDLIPAIFNEMFGDLAVNPDAWPGVSFGELLAVPLRNGLSPAKNGSHPAKVLTLSAITGEYFDDCASKEALFARMPDEGCMTSENLFLICRGNGNRELVGRAKFPRRLIGKIVFPDTMIAGVPDTEKLSPIFLEEMWNLPFIRRQIKSAARTTNGTFKINQTAIEEIRLPLPPLPRQKEFVSRVTDIREIEAKQATSRRRVDDLFQSLLDRAFKGEL